MYVRSMLTPANLRSAGFGACLLCVLGTVSAFAQAQRAPSARPTARALLAAKIRRGPASCARAVFVSRGDFSPASGGR